MGSVKKDRGALGGHYLRQWRELCGLTQDQAADELNVDRSLLSKIERFKTPYNQHLIEAAARLYGRTPGDLVAMDPAKMRGPSVDALLMERDVSGEDWQFVYDFAARLRGGGHGAEPAQEDRAPLIRTVAKRSNDHSPPKSKPGAR